MINNVWRGNVKKAMIDYMKKEKNDELYTPEMVLNY